MIAAIYARKSTEQNVADAAKSVTTQVAVAREFIATKGWTVKAAHEYIDDEMSGAEFERRPGFQRLMAALRPKPPFQVLIVRELARLGREASETAMTIKRLARAGVELFDVTGKSLTPKNWLEKAMSAVQSAADEAHREAASVLVHAAHTRLHKAGHVVGGRVFGYSRKKIFNGIDLDGEPKYSHTERVIDPTEAAVVRRIFEMYDSGLGLKRIAKLLTLEGAAAPKHYRRTDGLEPIVGWAPSTVRGVLTRETYRGCVVWNKTRKKDSWGQWAPSDRPESEWIRTTAKDLRIVSEELWLRIAARRKEREGKAVRFESGRLSGRPPKHSTVNLLAGLATCGVCGGGLVVERSNNKKGRYAYYICHRHRVTGACTNALRLVVTEMNEAVLQAVEEHALTPEAIEQIVQLTEREDVAGQQSQLARERKDTDTRIKRLVAAIETGGDVPSLVAKLRDLEARRHAIDTETAGLRPVPRLAPAVIENRLAEWRRLLRQSTTQSRTVLQRILRGRLTFTPRRNEISGEVDGYDFEGPTRFDKLFTGIALARPKDIDPSDKTGIEDIGPEDTFEGDYGRLLDRYFRKGWCALQDSNLRPPGS